MMLLSKVHRYVMYQQEITHFYLPLARLIHSAMSHTCPHTPAMELYHTLVSTYFQAGYGEAELAQLAHYGVTNYCLDL